MENTTRVTFDPHVMEGKPCIRGMRVTVGMIAGLVATGYSTEQILAVYPYLEATDIWEALNHHLLATEGYLEERANRVSEEKFLAAMAKVADVEPLDERDRWTSSEAHYLTAVLAELRVPYETQESVSQADSDDEEMM